MATRMGLEPMISAVTGRHSNQLNYRAADTVFQAVNIIIQVGVHLVNKTGGFRPQYVGKEKIVQKAIV